MKPNHQLRLIILFTAFAALTSCSKRYYAPGLYQNDIQLMLKPHSQDSAKSQVYVSGVFLTQTGAASQGSSNSGLLNIYQSHTLEHFNLSYGALAYAGAYNHSESTSDNVTTPAIQKGFLGYGFNGSGSFYFTSGKTDFRIIGVDLIYTHESGDYLRFRRQQSTIPGVQVAPQAGMFSLGIFSEFNIKANETTNAGGKLFLTRTLGNINHDLNKGTDGSYFDNNNTSVMVGFTGFVGVDHINFFGTVATSFRSTYFNAAGQIGLAYKF